MSLETETRDKRQDIDQRQRPIDERPERDERPGTRPRDTEQTFRQEAMAKDRHKD